VSGAFETLVMLTLGILNKEGKEIKMQFACCLGFVIVIGMHILDACWKINDENKNK
jgi:hypothetical protein